MIGEDQIKGYHAEQPEEVQSEEAKEKDEEFEERKKKALASIGRDQGIQNREPPGKEEIAEIAKKALSNTAAMKSHNETVLAHDIIALRMQNDAIIKAINNLTKEISGLKNEVRKIKWRQQP